MEEMLLKEFDCETELPQKKVNLILTAKHAKKKKKKDD